MKAAAIAMAALALGATGAAAQRGAQPGVGASYPPPGAVVRPPLPPAPVQPPLARAGGGDYADDGARWADEDERWPRRRFERHVERRFHDDGPGYPPPPAWVSADGRTTVTVTTGGGYPPPPAWGGYGCDCAGYGGAVTTVTVQSAPVVTTTTTEFVEDRVTYVRPVVRYVHARAVVRRAPTKLLRRPRPRAPRVVGS